MSSDDEIIAWSTRKKARRTIMESENESHDEEISVDETSINQESTNDNSQTNKEKHLMAKIIGEITGRRI